MRVYPFFPKAQTTSRFFNRLNIKREMCSAGGVRFEALPKNMGMLETADMQCALIIKLIS